MMQDSFKRARTDEQRQQRRAHILRVTRELLDGRRVADVSLNEIARQVGLAKSNIMRYFGSREAILLELMEQEYGAWVDDVAAARSTHKRPDQRPTQPIATALAASATRRPLFCELLSCLVTVLEHNVTVDEIISFKLRIYAHVNRLMGIIEQAMGDGQKDTQNKEQARAIVPPGIHALIVQFWVTAHPPTALRHAAEHDPRIYQPPTDITDTMAAALDAFLRGAYTAK